YTKRLPKSIKKIRCAFLEARSDFVRQKFPTKYHYDQMLPYKPADLNQLISHVKWANKTPFEMMDKFCIAWKRLLGCQRINLERFAQELIDQLSLTNLAALDIG